MRDISCTQGNGERESKKRKLTTKTLFHFVSVPKGRGFVSLSTHWKPMEGKRPLSWKLGRKELREDKKSFLKLKPFYFFTVIFLRGTLFFFCPFIGFSPLNLLHVQHITSVVDVTHGHLSHSRTTKR